MCGFSFFGIQMVDFLCSHSAMRFLPYRDATVRRSSGQGEEKRRTKRDALLKPQLADSESVKSSERTLTAREIAVEPRLSYFVGMCVYTQCVCL